MGDKMRINVAQIILAAIVLPFAFGFATPATEEIGEIQSGPLLLFCESDHYKGLSEILKDISAFIQEFAEDNGIGIKKTESGDSENGSAEKKAEEKKKDKPVRKDPGAPPEEETKKEPEKPDIFKRLWDLVIGSAVGSVTGGLCVMLCFYIWKLFTTFAPFEIFHGIWPVVPAAAASYLGCYIMTLREKETEDVDTDKIMYGLIIAIVIFIIFRCIYYHTSFIWQLVKGVFAAILGCSVSGAVSCVYCLYALMTPAKLTGIGAYLLLFFITAFAGILIGIEDRLVDAAEKHAGEDV